MDQSIKFYKAIKRAQAMMMANDGLEPTSALKQAATDCGIAEGEDLKVFVEWANKQWGI